MSAPKPTTLNALPLNQLALGLDELLRNPERVRALELLDPSGRALKRLQARQAEIDALPDGVDAVPLAEEVSTQDADHDVRGRLLFLMTEILERHPERTAAMIAAAEALKMVVPDLTITRTTLANEIAHVQAVAKRLPELRPALAAVVMPDGQDLAVWVERFVASGDAIGGLLNARGDIRARSDRSPASQVRNNLVRDLNKLRADVIEALDIDAALPRNLEATIFAYLDEMHRMDTARRG